MSLELLIDDHAFEIDLEALEDGVWEVIVDGEPFEVHVDPGETPGASTSTVGERAYEIQRDGRVLYVDGERADVAVQHLAQARIGAGQAAGGEITPPMPGRIVEILVEEGQTVEAGQGLVVLEAMKMQNEITAPGASTIVEVRVAEGDAVEASDVLVVLEPT